MAIKSKLHIGFLLLTSILLAGMGLGWLGQLANQLVSSITLCIAGIFGGIGVSLIVAGLQQYSPGALKGRIMSVYTIISQVTPALSGVIAGVLAEAISYSNALIVFAGIIVALTALFFFMPNNIRQMKQFS
jgi:MFS family permease